MSSKISDKQQQESKRQLDADSLLNRHIFNTLAYTAGGYAAGMAASLLFKRKAGIPLLAAGAGAGYGLSTLYADMNSFKKFQSQSGSSHTLKRNDLPDAKDWKNYQVKEENQYNAKPRYGGSDDSDNSDSKDKSDKDDNRSEMSKSIKTPRPEPEIRTTNSKENDKKQTTDKPSQMKSEGKSDDKSDKSDNRSEMSKSIKTPRPEPEIKTTNSKENDKKQTTDKPSQMKSEGKTNEKSEKGVDHQKDQSKLTNLEGKAYQGSGDKGEKSEGKTDHKSSNSKTETKSGSKPGASSDFAKAEEGKTDADRGIDQRNKGTDNKTPAVKGGSSTGGMAPSHNLGFASAGTRSPGELPEGTSENNRRGNNTDKVNEQLTSQRVSEQDRWGASTVTGLKMKVGAEDSNVAGGQFRSGSSAGSQVNAVIE